MFVTRSRTKRQGSSVERTRAIRPSPTPLHTSANSLASRQAHAGADATNRASGTSTSIVSTTTHPRGMPVPPPPIPMPSGTSPTAAPTSTSTSEQARNTPTHSSQMRTKARCVGFQQPACPPMPLRRNSRRV